MNKFLSLSYLSSSTQRTRTTWTAFSRDGQHGPGSCPKRLELLEGAQGTPGRWSGQQQGPGRCKPAGGPSGRATASLLLPSPSPPSSACRRTRSSGSGDPPHPRLPRGTCTRSSPPRPRFLQLRPPDSSTLCHDLQAPSRAVRSSWVAPLAAQDLPGYCGGGCGLLLRRRPRLRRSGPFWVSGQPAIPRESSCWFETG